MKYAPAGSATRSTKIPASLPSPSIKSLGHLTSAGAPIPLKAEAIDAAATKVDMAFWVGESPAPDTRMENMIALPGIPIHFFPWRPRPLVWKCATRTTLSGALRGKGDGSRAKSLVETHESRASKANPSSQACSKASRSKNTKGRLAWYTPVAASNEMRPA